MPRPPFTAHAHTRGASSRLARAVRATVGRWRGAQRGHAGDRLTRLEDDLREVRTRVNALFFAVIAVGLSDLVGRLLR